MFERRTTHLGRVSLRISLASSIAGPNKGFSAALSVRIYLNVLSGYSGETVMGCVTSSCTALQHATVQTKRSLSAIRMANATGFLLKLARLKPICAHRKFEKKFLGNNQNLLRQNFAKWCF